MIMKRSYIVARWFFVGTVIIFLCSGCALWDRYFSSEDERTASELMNDGMEQFEKGYFEEATEMFQLLKDRYPYSKFAVQAELKMADALYERELYDEAFDSYHDFEGLHPKNPVIPYVIYRQGMCHFNKITTIDRTPMHTLKAKEEFERLVRRFPSSEYADSVRMKIRECYINLAEYELYVGHFYYKMEKYRAAMARYRYLISNYPDLGQYHEALEFLRRCQEKMPDAQEEQNLENSSPSWWHRLTHIFN